MRATATVLLLVVLSAPALAGETVTFTTADGMKIVGTWYPSGRKGAAGVVALPMYRQDRSTYAPVADRFTKAGMDFLAIDMRGHGESAVQDGKDLSKRVESRDPDLFNAMWKDALAARKFLIAKGADPNRVGLLGASVGCSVAIDATSRTEKIPGACVMTPGKKYLGVDTMGDLAGYGDRPLLILSSKEEAEAGAMAIKEKLGASVELVLYDEKRVHGTRMFGKVPGVEEKIVRWFGDLLGGDVALDGRLDERERPDHPIWVWEGKDGKKLHFHVRVRPRWMHVVASPVAGGEPPEEIGLAWSSVPDLSKGRSVTWFAKNGSFRHQVKRDGKWMPIRRKKAPNRPEPGAARGKVIEMLIPIGERGLGLEIGPDLRLKLLTKGPYGVVESGWMARKE